MPTDVKAIASSGTGGILKRHEQKKKRGKIEEERPDSTAL
jgi:hypothetical protein